MNLIEENGKFYIELLDGRVEIKEQEAKEAIEQAIIVKQYIEKWLDYYRNNRWSITNVPNDADAYIKLEIFYEQSIKAIGELYNTTNDKERFVKSFEIVFNEQIRKLERKLLIPHISNKKIIKNKLKISEDLLNFIRNLPTAAKAGEYCFYTNFDLKNFIINLIENVLEKEILMKDGYINFWRDRSCKLPKDEVEMHPYISNTLNHYCEVRGVVLTREERAANGNVDITFCYTNKEKKY